MRNLLGVTVTPDKNDFELKLYPNPRISGHVTDEKGEPVEGVRVQLLAGHLVIGGRMQWRDSELSTTDAEGAFTFHYLVPGHYILFASGHTRPAMAWNASPEVTDPAYYPTAGDMSSAQTIDLQNGQDFLADFHLRSEHGYRVVVPVSRGSSNGAVTVSVRNSSGQIVHFSGVHYDSKQGQIIAPALPSGIWTVQATAAGGTAGEDVTVDHSDINAPPLVLHPGQTIPLIVNHVAASDGTFRPTLISQGGGELLPGSVGFGGISPGKYSLKFWLPRNECVDSATSGGIDLMRDYLVVDGNGAAQPIIVNMRTDCATLNISVRSAAHEFIAELVIMPDSSSGKPEVNTLSVGIPIGRKVPQIQPSDPRFTMPQPRFTLSPGTYRVYALSNIDELEYTNPEVMHNYPSKSVTLKAGDKTDLTIDLTERKPN